MDTTWTRDRFASTVSRPRGRMLSTVSSVMESAGIAYEKHEEGVLCVEQERTDLLDVLVLDKVFNFLMPSLYYTSIR